MEELSYLNQIKYWFAEDIGDGDHTSLSCIPNDAMGKQQLIVKEDGILAGVEVAKQIFHYFDPEIKVETFIEDGAEVHVGDVAFVASGKVVSLLQVERLMLNIMQRMSGVATTTHKYVELLKGTKTRVLDTRKTTPGLRMLEKEAVRIIEKGYVHPAYDYVLKCSHTFNLLDARGAISVSQRAAFIGRVRRLARLCAECYLKQREELGYPMLHRGEH